jgi:hypothetical protein
MTLEQKLIQLIHLIHLFRLRGKFFFFELPPRQGLERKAHRICIGKSEDLERKARFFCPAAGKKRRPNFSASE